MYLYLLLLPLFLFLLWLLTRNTEKVEFIGVTKEDLAKVFQKEKVEEEITADLLPYPSKKSKGEKECCRVLEEIFALPFYTVRPNFLRNPETGKNLEIDCFNPQVKVAVEYNGIQHYAFPNFTGMSRKEFFNQIRRDEFKKERCQEEGINLIIVPYTVPVEKIGEYIRERL